MEIQDSFWQIFLPEAQEIIFTQTKVLGEYDGLNLGKNNLAADPMLELTFKYQTTTSW